MAAQNIFYDRDKRLMYLWDDRRQGVSQFEYKPYGFIKSPNGTFFTLDGQKVAKTTYITDELRKSGELYESDVSPEVRTLIDMYSDDEVSKNHRYFFFDIEVAKELQHSTATAATNKITSFCYYSNVTGKYIILLLDALQKIAPINTADFEVYGFATEAELLKNIVSHWRNINPTIITGWNTMQYDVPYLYNRITQILGVKVANSLSPINKVILDDRNGTYKIAGISHLDYMLVYKKFTPNEHTSYSLEAIAQEELGTGKIKYDGDLDLLYSTDIMKFILYNMVDVKLVKDLDDKLSYIELVRNTCHKGHVPYEQIYQTSSYLDGAALAYTKSLGLVAPNKQTPHNFVVGTLHTKGSNKLLMTEDIPDKIPKSGTLRIFKSKTSHFEITYSSYKDNYFILEKPLTRDVMTKYKIKLNLPGAFVKVPVKGIHQWVYDLDLKSLYPSIIISLNISPETKIGKVINWNSAWFVRKTDDVFEISIKGKIIKKTAAELKPWLVEKNYSIAANGVMYDLNKKGIIPAILEKWFAERDEFKTLMKKYGAAGDNVMKQFFHIRQWVQKILLNSFYGVLGLPSFRYYDLDNASAITTTGQYIIKHSAKTANKFYNTVLGTTDVDYVIYVDTDSLFLSALPLIKHKYPNVNVADTAAMSKLILEIATQVQGIINKSYDSYSKNIHNVANHIFSIKQEFIARTALWLAKKRYAQWIINAEGLPCDMLDVKGLDVVRSDFPIAFRPFVRSILKDILDRKTQSEITSKIIEFRKTIPTLNILEIMSPSGVKGITKYTYDGRDRLEVVKGTPIHVKGCVFYNDIMDFNHITNISKIVDGDKIKWAYLKQNPYNIENIAIKGYEDPEVILEFVKQYIDHDKIFNGAIVDKIQQFYDALGWGTINMNEKSTEFFEF